MNVALYVRVSTQEQATEGYSIGEQTERLKKYSEAHGWDVYKIYTDPGYSGANMTRPALMMMISDAAAGKFEKVIVYKLDRLSRSQKDTLMIIEDILLANNVDFISMSENFDTSTPFGKAIMGILAVFAQLEREQIKERLKMGKEARAKKGKFSGGGGIPYGYDLVEKELVINSYEAMVVQKIFDYAQEGKGLRQIANILNEEGFRSKKSEWNPPSVRNVLYSKAYLGCIKFRKKWIEGNHEPIISADQYESVHKILDKRKNDIKCNMNPGKISSSLGGLIYCAQCGGKYYRNTISLHRNGTIYKYIRYTCQGRQPRGNPKFKDVKCKNKVWDLEELTGLVYEELMKLSSDPEYFNQIKSSPAKIDNIRAIKAELSKIDDQVSKLVDLYAVESMPVEIIKSKIDDLDSKKRILQEELIKAEDEKQKESEIKELKKIIKMIPGLLKNGTNSEIHAVVSELIDKILIDGEDITIYWKF
jgi:site-specific DNA recombinase